MKKVKNLLIILFLGIALCLIPSISNAAVNVTKNAYASDGSVKFSFTGLTLDKTHEYEFGLTKTAASSVEKWYLLTEYTENTATVDITANTFKDVMLAVETGYVTIKDKTTDTVVLQPYAVDLSIPYLKISNFTVLNNGKKFNRYDGDDGVISINLWNVDKCTPYFQYEKITDTNVIEKYKEIKKKNGDFSELQSILKTTAPTSNWKNWDYSNGYFDHLYGYTQQEVSAPDYGLYYMWIYLAGKNVRNLYGYILVDNLEPEIALESITLPKTKEVEVGKTIKLTPTFNPETTTNKIVTWSSSDESVATVDNAGTVTAKKVGGTIITVTSQDGNKRATCTVTVIDSNGNSGTNNNDTQTQTQTSETTTTPSETKVTESKPTQATTDKETYLDIVQKESEIKYLENDQGNITKKIISSNTKTGEVTIELQVSNTKKDVKVIDDTEVFLVVDNSPSMDFVTTSGKTRKEIVLDSAKKLVEGIYNNSSNVNIGLIDFDGYGATYRQKLTTDKTVMLEAIDKRLNSRTVSGTNIAAGLQKAQKNFSNNVKNKIVILLTDGIPTEDANGNSCGNKVTTEKAIKVQDNTKNTLESLKKDGIYTITMLTGISASDGNKDKSGTVYTKQNTEEEELAAAERIFGTQEKPTADKYYLVKSVDVDTIISKDILNDVSAKIRNPINNVKIVDYFPSDIIDNFEFYYVGKPSVGTISEAIDTKNNTITWDIGTLKGDETATIKYKLKIKDMKNANILNKTISTNEKVVLTYKDVNSKDYTVILTSSPKICLKEVKEQEVTSGSATDPTTAKTKATVLPNTGASVAIIGGIAFVIVIGIAGFAKYRKLKDVK